MSIYLGNLSITDIEQRSGVTFPAELREFMEDKHQANASKVAEGKWHCFDIPFVLVCGDMGTATKIHSHLVQFLSQFKEPLQIALSEAAHGIKGEA